MRTPRRALMLLRTRVLLLAAALALSACAATPTPAQIPGPGARATETSAETIPGSAGDIHDFDFLIGNWKAERRRLVVRGAGSHDWETFTGTNDVKIYLGGMVSVEETASPTKGARGLSINVFDPEKRQWRVYEIDGKVGKIESPLVGTFVGNRGEFHGEDEDQGRPIQVRYIWLKTGPNTAHWEQAFSYDQGRTWETNRTTDFTRTPP